MTAVAAPEGIENELAACSLAEVEQAYAEMSLVEFVRQAWAVINPETPYRHNWHIDAICDHLEAVASGQIKNLLITTTLKSGKSIIAGAFYPAWVWATRPWIQWIFCSHSFSLAVRDSRHCRQVIESRWYQERWGRVFQLTSDQNEKVRYENDQSGARLTTSLGGEGTGEGAHIIVCDDPHNVDRVESDTQRMAALESWDQKLSVRHIPGAPVEGRIIIMQRSHPADLAAHALEQGGYEHLNIPMEFDAKKKCVTALGWEDPRKEEGELMWPEVYPETKVADLRRRLGSRGFGAQCNQHPTPRGGNIVKDFWLKYYDKRPEQFDRVILSGDLSFKDTTDGSFVVLAVFGLVGVNKYLLDIFRKRVDFPNTLAAIRMMIERWPSIDAVIIEDKANGPAVVATLKNEIAGLIAWQSASSKESRLHAISPQIEAGNLFLPQPEKCDWIDTYITELTAFPGGENDDQVDATTQAFLWLETDSVVPMVYV